jgi:tripeptidyl-peptidase I
MRIPLSRLNFLLAISGPSFVYAASWVHNSYKVKECVVPPKGWVKQNPPPPDHEIQLRIGLPQPNFGTLEDQLYQVSDPYHQRYGQHLGKEEVEDLVAPDEDSIDLVNEWLRSHGFTDSDINWSPASDWANINVSVSVAEKLLDTVRRICLL